MPPELDRGEPQRDGVESGVRGVEGEELGDTGSLYLAERLGALEPAAAKYLEKQTAGEQKESTGHFLALWEEVKKETPNIHESLIREALRGQLGLKIFMALMDHQDEIHDVNSSSVLNSAQTVEGCALATKVWRIRRAAVNYLKIRKQAWTDWREDCSPEEEAEAAEEREFFTGQMEEFKRNDEAVHECIVKAALDGYMGNQAQLAMVAYQEAVARKKANMEEGGLKGNSGEGSPPGETGSLKEAGREKEMLTPKRQPNPMGAISRSVPPETETSSPLVPDWLKGWSG